MSNEFKINTITYQIDNPLDANSFVGIRIINREFHVTISKMYQIINDEVNSKLFSNFANNRKELMDLYKTIAIAKSLTMENDNKESDTYEIDYDNKKKPIPSYINYIKQKLDFNFVKTDFITKYFANFNHFIVF